MSLLRPNQWCEMIADGTCIFVIVMSAFLKRTWFLRYVMHGGFCCDEQEKWNQNSHGLKIKVFSPCL